jgi:DNA cross-link repair 1A protein
LIKYKLGVKDEWVKPQPNDVPFEVAGTRCTVLDANHCPGSSIFLFEGPHTSPNSPHYRAPGSTAKARQFRYLHCGDFRASPAHLLHPALKDKKLDICYLDTTYLNPKYCFPAQEQVINACSELVRCRMLGDRDALKKGSGGGAQLVRQGEMMKGWLSKAKKEELLEEGLLDVTATSAIVKADPGNDNKPSLEDVKDEKPRERLLVMVGTYSIGKERIVKGGCSCHAGLVLSGIR